jgi:hypothetical protein
MSAYLNSFSDNDDSVNTDSGEQNALIDMVQDDIDVEEENKEDNVVRSGNALKRPREGEVH